MLTFIFRMIQWKLGFLVLGLIVYLLQLPPEQRGPRLRQLSSRTLGEIENLASRGREALADEDAELGDALLAEDEGLGVLGQKILPDDFRRELAAAVHRLDVDMVRDRWMAIEYARVRSDGDRAAVLREAASLVVLFRRSAWPVDGRWVPTEQVEKYLVVYSRTRSG